MLLTACELGCALASVSHETQCSYPSRIFRPAHGGGQGRTATGELRQDLQPCVKKPYESLNTHVGNHACATPQSLDTRTCATPQSLDTRTCVTPQSLDTRTCATPQSPRYPHSPHVICVRAVLWRRCNSSSAARSGERYVRHRVGFG